MGKLILILYNTLNFSPTIEAEAHVGYIVEGASPSWGESISLNLIRDALEIPQNVISIGLGLLITVVIFLLLPRLKFYKVIEEYLNNKLHHYIPIIPWIIRISVGGALVGAGISGHLVSPLLTTTEFWSNLQIIAGLLILTGAGLSIGILLGIVIYVFALAHNLYLLGNVDVLVLLFALLFIGYSRPGVDDILNIPQIKIGDVYAKIVPGFISTGLGFAMIFLSIYEKFFNFAASMVVVERYGLDVATGISPEMWVLGAGVVELTLGIMLVYRFKIRIVSLVSIIVLMTSLFVFKESIYSHITLIGALTVLFITEAKSFPSKNIFRWLT